MDGKKILVVGSGNRHGMSERGVFMQLFASIMGMGARDREVALVDLPVQADELKAVDLPRVKAGPSMFERVMARTLRAAPSQRPGKHVQYCTVPVGERAASRRAVQLARAHQRRMGLTF